MRHSKSTGGKDIDWRGVWLSIQDVAQNLYWLVLLPLRLVGLAWELTIAVGIGIVRFWVHFCAAMLGLIFVLFVGYCMARALLYPLFGPY